MRKGICADVARNIKPPEAKGLTVKMTRDSDIFVPLELRARTANASKDAIFVSIHFNATDMNWPRAVLKFSHATARRARLLGRRALALRL
jgi:N-acetylmuramoyl-L-alanine amidase